MSDKPSYLQPVRSLDLRGIDVLVGVDARRGGRMDAATVQSRATIEESIAESSVRAVPSDVQPSAEQKTQHANALAQFFKARSKPRAYAATGVKVGIGLTVAGLLVVLLRQLAAARKK